MTTVGFIGLGIMGAPMAANLIKAGFDVVGHNRSEEKTRALVDAGGRAAMSTAEAVSGADAVVTMLPDSPDVHSVMLGDGGVFDSARQGALVIDMSTVRPDLAEELAHIGAGRGLRVLDAPVSGGEAGAIEGTLSIMVGGQANHFEAARPVFEALGRTIIHVGPAGAGQTVKAANQLIVAGNIQLVAEAIVFLEAHGVDMHAALEVLSGGLAASAVLTQKGPKMLAREFGPGFRLELHHKDLGILQAAARRAEAIIPLGSVVSQLVAASVAQGSGGLDHSALFELANRLSGGEVD